MVFWKSAGHSAIELGDPLSLIANCAQRTRTHTPLHTGNVWSLTSSRIITMFVFVVSQRFVQTSPAPITALHSKYTVHMSRQR